MSFSLLKDINCMKNMFKKMQVGEKNPRLHLDSLEPAAI